MIVTVTCPRCGIDRSFLRPPIVKCPHCGTPYLEDVRHTGEATLARAAAVEAAPRPTGLTIAMFVFIGFGALFFLSMACAAVDVGAFYINDVQVTGREFLAHGGGFLFTLVGLVALTIALSLWRDWWWSRWLILLALGIPSLVGVAFAIVSGDTSTIATAVLQAAILLGPMAAYLFLKNSVVAYYEARRPQRWQHGESGKGA